MKEPIKAVVNVAAYMTEARNLLSSVEYGGLTNSTAMGYLAYAILEVPKAAAKLKDDSSNTFFCMEYQQPLGLLWKAHNMLAANASEMNPCVYGEAAGIVATAHLQFRKFHKRLDYREINDLDLAGADRPGVGGGGGR